VGGDGGPTAAELGRRRQGGAGGRGGCGIGRPNDRDDGPPVEVVLRASTASVEVVLRLAAAVECSRSPSEARAAAAACGRAVRWAAAAGRGVYAAGAVGADVGQSESGRVGRGRMRDRVPPIYDGVMCAVVDYYYL
jgi:hypothetical protein